MRGPLICPKHGDFSDNAAWVNCWTGCNEGYFDDYEHDPSYYEPGSVSMCGECLGEGGWKVCGECNANNPDAEPVMPEKEERMMYSPQGLFCPNCGEQLYGSALNMEHVNSPMCSETCREEWALKYARMLLGKEEPTK